FRVSFPVLLFRLSPAVAATRGLFRHACRGRRRACRHGRACLPVLRLRGGLCLPARLSPFQVFSVQVCVSCASLSSRRGCYHPSPEARYGLLSSALPVW